LKRAGRNEIDTLEKKRGKNGREEKRQTQEENRISSRHH
jgi:hypothetical protein